MAQPADPSFHHGPRRPSGMPTQSQRPQDLPESPAHAIGSDGIPRLKRTACILCRKRKLRCDQLRPKCGTCDRLGHDCQYDEGGRKKSGPKRGYVKALEARLAQVETLLKSQDSSDPTGRGGDAYDDAGTLGMDNPLPGPELDQFPDNIISRNRPSFSARQRPALERGDSASQGPSPAAQNKTPTSKTQEQQEVEGAIDLGGEFSFDMISLGLEEPLPTQEIMSDLNRIFFEKAHSFLPMIHKARYQAALDLPPAMRPPVCLRYAMWALAAGSTDRYEAMAPHFYHRARKYLDLDEMKGFGQAILTLSHCQTWILVTIYEFKNMFFPRAWMSTGRATRLAQMLGLHRVDGAGLDVKQTLPAPKDWAEKEERRRTFWMAFWCDRCASIGTGWPMSLEEKDISTDLPSPEDSLQHGRAESRTTLQQALRNGGRDLNPVSGATLMATLFGRNLMHLHRQEPGEDERDLEGSFWREHRWIDDTLNKLALGLPESLKLPAGISNPNVIFLNMCLQSSAICLHQAAIYKAVKFDLPPSIKHSSTMKCMAAADEIATIMRSVCGTSNMDCMTMNPFLPFCLYVAARVFVLSLKARPDDQRTLSSLTFLLQAMSAMTRRTAIAESFIAQLELDMQVADVPNPLGSAAEPPNDPTFSTYNMFAKTDGSKTDIYYNPYDTMIPALSRGPARQGACFYRGEGPGSRSESGPSYGASGSTPAPNSGGRWPATPSESSDPRLFPGSAVSGNMMTRSNALGPSDRSRDGAVVEMDTSPGGSGAGAADARTRSDQASRTGSVAAAMTPAGASEKNSPTATRKATSAYPLMGNQLYTQYHHAHVNAPSNLYSTDYAMFGDMGNLSNVMETTGMTPNAEAWSDMMGLAQEEWPSQMHGGIGNHR